MSIEKKYLVNKLDDNLKEIALLRLEYPDMSLIELGKKLKSEKAWNQTLFDKLSKDIIK